VLEQTPNVACLPVDTVFKHQKCTVGSQNTMHCPVLPDGLGAKRAKCMSLTDKDFVSAWMIKAQSQLELSQVDNDSDSSFGMFEACAIP